MTSLEKFTNVVMMVASHHLGLVGSDKVHITIPTKYLRETVGVIKLETMDVYRNHDEVRSRSGSDVLARFILQLSRVNVTA